MAKNSSYHLKFDVYPDLISQYKTGGKGSVPGWGTKIPHAMGSMT